MMKKLSIIIPHYKEELNVLRPLLSSIDIQLAVNFDDIEVIVVNDGKDAVPLTQEFINSFSNIHITYLPQQINKGLAAARNIGFDNSKGEYVMYCDSDDRFHNVASLWTYLQEIEKGYDYIAASWLREIVCDDQLQYKIEQYDSTCVHAKVFKRSFLLKYDIRFLDEFRCHEDTYFVGLAYDLADNKKFINYTTYVWCANNNSMTREKEESFLYKEFHTFHKSAYQLFAAIERYKPQNMPYRILQNSIYVYFMYQRSCWEKEGNKYLKQSEEEFIKLMNRFYKYMKDADQELVTKVYKETEALGYGTYIRESYEDFIKRITNNI